MRAPSGDTAGWLLDESVDVRDRGGSPPAGTSQSRVAPSFVSIEYVVTGTTAKAPSEEGTGDPTRGIAQRSSTVIGRRGMEEPPRFARGRKRHRH